MRRLRSLQKVVTSQPRDLSPGPPTLPGPPPVLRLLTCRTCSPERAHTNTLLPVLSPGTQVGAVFVLENRWCAEAQTGVRGAQLSVKEPKEVCPDSQLTPVSTFGSEKAFWLCLCKCAILQLDRPCSPGLTSSPERDAGVSGEDSGCVRLGPGQLRTRGCGLHWAQACLSSIMSAPRH